MRIIDARFEKINKKMNGLWQNTIMAYEEILITYKYSDKKKAVSVINNDRTINQLHDDINDEIIDTIMLQAPMASDMRFLISTMKIVDHLERIADYPVNIANYIIIKEDTKIVIGDIIVEMIEYALTMLGKAYQAYNEIDLDISREIIDMDWKMDALYKESVEQFVVQKNSVLKNELRARENFQTLLIVKYLERTGDNIARIGEEIFFMVKGSFNDNYTKSSMLDE